MALIIKSLAVDPPNFDELSDDEDDFVKDPAQYRDQLPHPYRYIDEFLTLFLDEVWEEITLRENDRAADRSKIRPPKYECALQLQEHPTTKAMTSTDDGRYVFMAFPGGLSLLDAAKRKVLHTLEDDRLDLCSLKCTIINAETYLLTGVDELGMCRVFGCSVEKLFVMRVMNEESTHKFQAVKCEASVDGDYLGVVLENPSGNETMLEVYQLPRDIWIKEIEDIKPKLIQTEEPKIQDTSLSQQLPTTEEAQEDAVVESTPREAPVIDSTEDGDQQMSARKSHESAGSKKGGNYKFTPTNLVMRHHPPEKLVANAGVSPAANLATITDPKLILASGQGHLLSRPYMEIRQEAFTNMHKDKLIYKMPQDETEGEHRDCNFHFFTPGLAIPFGIEQPGALRKPSSIGIWWSGSSQFIYYSLTKPVKVKKTGADAQDAASRRSRVRVALPGQALGTPRTEPVEAGPSTSSLFPNRPELDIKPETVWPQAEVITASAMSPDSSLLAIGLRNGIVTVWDKHLCCVRKSISVCKTPITKLEFVNPSICPQSNNRHQVYPTTTSCYVLVRGEDSSLHLLNCGQRNFSPPITIADKATEDDNVITSVELFPERCPEIILKTYKSGSMFLQDVSSTNTLCEICLPSTHELTNPWQPILSVSACGQMLYVKGTQKAADEEYVDKSTQSVFVFQLRSFPALDSHWTKIRPQIDYISFSPIDTRVGALLSHRVKTSGARKERLQQRWPLMKQELARISQIKSH